MTTIRARPGSSEAYREQGVVENRLWWKQGRPAGVPSGEAALRRAIELSPTDFDALASLGGILKREQRYAESLELYYRSVEASGGHPYPLLNGLKLEARETGRLQLDETRLLERAERRLSLQVADRPPHDAPWSFFDLAEIRLYLGQRDEFRSLIEEGTHWCTEAWQATTCWESLQLLVGGGADCPELRQGMDALLRAVERLDS
jgi:tetratricopeptide (TPR) repeat protein